MWNAWHNQVSRLEVTLNILRRAAVVVAVRIHARHESRFIASAGKGVLLHKPFVALQEEQSHHRQSGGMRSNAGDGRVTLAVSERNNAIIKHHRSGCAGKYDKRLIVVTIAWRQSG